MFDDAIAEVVKELLRVEPFRPFVIFTVDGHDFKVTDPSHVTWDAEGQIVHLGDPEGVLESVVVS